MEKTFSNSEMPHYVEKSAEIVHDFFDFNTISAHLLFFDKWIGCLLGTRKKTIKPEEITLFSEKLSRLLLYLEKINVGDHEADFAVAENSRDSFRMTATALPVSLTEKEIIDPEAGIRKIFKKRSAADYVMTLAYWEACVLSGKRFDDAVLVYPIYLNLRKAIELSWLIRERLTGFNAGSVGSPDQGHIAFALTCPLLLNREELLDPYLVLESFFGFAGLDEYREDLLEWFKATLSSDAAYPSPSNLLFIHNQFLQLLQAAYLIGKMTTKYMPKMDYTKNHATCGHWLLDQMYPDASTSYPAKLLVRSLPTAYIEDPYLFFKEHITLSNLSELRQGLKNWLETGLSKNSSMITADHTLGFDLHATLLQLLEASFLILITPALSTHFSSTEKR